MTQLPHKNQTPHQLDSLEWVRLKKYCELSGDTPNAVHARKRKGEWFKDKHWRLAPDRHIWINLTEIKQWIIQPKTVKYLRNILTPLRAILNEAVNDDLIVKNPLDRVMLNKLLDKNTAKSNYVPDPFNRQEIQALLAVAEGQIKNLVQFMCFSGLRPSEWIGLEWQDIDWNNGLAHIHRAVVAKQEKSTKTKAGVRQLVLLPPALQALNAQKPYTFSFGKQVFFNPLHDKPWICDAHFRTPHWIRLFKLSGVRYRNPYQTRHYVELRIMQSYFVIYPLQMSFRII